MKFLEVIKYEGDNKTLVWKHPAEDFNTSSTLIVHESQQAIFFKNGQIADVFSAGRYVLKTENIPLLRKLINLPTGGESTFHCEVYFVNTVERMALRWGTDSKVQFIEPTYQFPMEIGASGEMSIQISDAANFLVRLVGTETQLTHEGLIRYFRALLMTKVKAYLARTIKEKQLNIFEIDSQLDILSENIKMRLLGDFDHYGIRLAQFYISNVVRPEDDPAYCRVKEAAARRYTDIFEEQTRQQVDLIRQQTQSQMRIMDAQSIAEKRRLEGYSYQEERGFDVAAKVAENQAVGQFASMGMGLGMMTGIGGAMAGSVGAMVGGVMQPPIGMPTGQPAGAAPVTPETKTAPSENEMHSGAVVQAPATAESDEPQQSANRCACGQELPAGAKFCFACGAPQLSPFCPNCGAKRVENAKFCLECGQKL